MCSVIMIIYSCRAFIPAEYSTTEVFMYCQLFFCPEHSVGLVCYPKETIQVLIKE
jgi:hypothetical protein